MNEVREARKLLTELRNECKTDEDSFILEYRIHGNCPTCNITTDICFNCSKNINKILKSANNHHDFYYEEVIRQYPSFMKLLNNPSKDLIRKTVAKNVYLINSVNNLSPEMAKELLLMNKNVFYYLKKDWKKETLEDTLRYLDALIESEDFSFFLNTGKIESN